MKTFFVSDPHFSHFNIIKYSNRPYNSVEEMNEALISNWNNKVSDNDTIYCLGDFVFGVDSKRPEIFFDKLNGKKHLIRGNHDNDITANLPWESVSELKEIKVKKQRIILCHYAMKVWRHSYKGTYMLYGHSHQTLPEDDSLSFDVGVDGWNYSPVSFEQVDAKMNWKKNNKNYFKNNKVFSTSSEFDERSYLNKEFLQNFNKQFL
jgi:calcineurin-like phosphoesterase family protein